MGGLNPPWILTQLRWFRTLRGLFLFDHSNHYLKNCPQTNAFYKLYYAKKVQTHNIIKFVSGSLTVELIQIRRTNQTNPHCGLGACGVGPWTLVMKIDGSKVIMVFLKRENICVQGFGNLRTDKKCWSDRIGRCMIFVIRANESEGTNLTITRYGTSDAPWFKLLALLQCLYITIGNYCFLHISQGMQRKLD